MLNYQNIFIIRVDKAHVQRGEKTMFETAIEFFIGLTEVGLMALGLWIFLKFVPALFHKEK